MTGAGAMPVRAPLAELAHHYEVIVVGGGITGAGIFCEAARAGAKVLLVEGRDYASGTSSWSSKLVHGGLRYLKTGEWKLTAESVAERQRLLADAPELVQPLRFLLPIYRGKKPSKFTMRMGLWLYDYFAKGGEPSRWLTAAQTLALQGELAPQDLQGAMQYLDARTDDCRLTLALIQQGQALGGTARNYSRVQSLLSAQGRFTGVALSDELSGQQREITAGVVINATGVWASGMPGQGACAPALRPLKGSHLVFPQAKLPLHQAISWLHPKDQRPIFAYPWQGATLLGTTDLDYGDYLADPVMHGEECTYLLQGLAAVFPKLGLTHADAISSFAGVRPIVADGAGKPSEASRESAMWSAPGLVGITGGKLTTFRVTARQVLAEAAKQLPSLQLASANTPLFSLPLAGHAPDLAPDVPRVEAAASEQVVYLDDLLLRRTRAGLALPGYGAALLEEATEACQRQYLWDSHRARQEKIRYLEHAQQQHRVPVPV